MGQVRRLAERVVPRRLRPVLVRVARSCVWAPSFAWLRVSGRRRVPGRAALALLRFGWGNPHYVAGTGYLREVAARAADGTGTIVEAGSGLTTVLVALVAPPERERVAYEHRPEWATEVARRSRGAACVHVSELRDRGDHEWYDLVPPPPGQVDLVICDGPPGSTPGGRYGALPMLHDRLAPGAVLLLDDVDRAGERAVLDRWAAEFGVVAEIRGTGADAFAVVRRPGPA